jgi:hypothetical protein
VSTIKTYKESERVARWRRRLWDRKLDNAHVEEIINAVMQTEVERDALARTLATLAAAGIVVGEDGAVRWHGLTGAEIEGQREALQEIRAKAFEEDQYAWHHGVLEPGKPGWFWSVANAALAAAAGRGAEGETTDA